MQTLLLCIFGSNINAYCFSQLHGEMPLQEHPQIIPANLWVSMSGEGGRRTIRESTAHYGHQKQQNEFHFRVSSLNVFIMFACVSSAEVASQVLN